MATLQERLHDGVRELRGLLARHSTHSVVGWCFGPVVTTEQEKTDNRLLSPDRQVSFLLAILLSTPEPERSSGLTATDWHRARELLNTIFSAYFQLYFPTLDERGKITAEWRRVREVSMAAFFHYFTSGLIASVEQVAERVDAYIAGFDDDLEPLIGIRSSDAIEICRFITNKLQQGLDRLGAAISDEQTRRDALLDRVKTEGRSLEELGVEWKDPWAQTASEVIDGVRRLGLITLPELIERFPRTARPYWERFTIARGEGPEIRYPTDPTAFDTRSLIRLDQETAFCVSANDLFSAVLRTAEAALLSSSLRQQYLRARDKALEREVASWARTLLGPDATIWERAYETPDSHFEHDVIAFDQHLCLIFEAKASPPPEPLRDPEKAFVRLRDGFRNGIQKAYNQGNRIVSRLQKGEVVPLFDDAGHELGTLLPNVSDLIVCACVTRDDFGALATYLTLLLEKAPGDAYPWAVNIVDLSTLSEAWSYFKWGSRELRDYLEQRLTLHGKVFAAYELDYVGCFIQHGGFSSFQKNNAIVQLSTDYSDIFDAIYRHIYYGAPPVEINRKKPVLTDLRRSLASGQPVFVDSIHTAAKVGRNMPCPCGSRKKYKKCCGRGG